MLYLLYAKEPRGRSLGVLSRYLMLIRRPAGRQSLLRRYEP